MYTYIYRCKYRDMSGLRRRAYGLGAVLGIRVDGLRIGFEGLGFRD